MIKDIQEKIQKGELNLTENVNDFLNNFENINSELNAFVSKNDNAINDAKLSEQRIKDGKALRLDGIKIGIKDNILVKDLKSTSGSKILKEYVASYDATVVKKIKEAGGIIIGKTNMDEFAMGSSNETSYFGVVKNPIDKTKVSGGSSGGSAASVVGLLADVALGSDTAGSIRQPASFCGVVGFKPTYGAVSRFGLMAMSSSLDVVGVIAKNVSDCETVFDVISGKDDYDSTSIEVLKDDKEYTIDDLKNLIVGIPKEYFIEGIDKEVKEKVDGFVLKLKELGVKIQEISLPHTKYAIACYYIIMPAEVSSNLSRYDNIRYGSKIEDLKELNISNLKDLYFKTRGDGFGIEVKRRILLGTYVLSKGFYDEYYTKAQKVRRLIKNDFGKAFSEVDMIITPTCPDKAFSFGEKSKDPISMYLSDIFTVPMNLAGVPAISLPLAKGEEGLPIGIQFVMNDKLDNKLLKVSKVLESIIKYG